jgi:glycerol-3-phosphate O-acyltransferase
MGGTVELPTWFVVLAAVLATIGLFDRLLVPTARFVLRRRINEAIDELNMRLRLRIQPFKLARRDGLIDRIVYDQDVMRAAEARANETGVPRAVVMEKVKAYAREIVPSFSAYAYFKFGARAARFLSTLLYRVRLGYMNDEALRQVDPDSAVVFVINHRSNMDYVLVTYLAAGSSALSYAVGEWARVVFLQSMIAPWAPISCGAIRATRSIGACSPATCNWRPARALPRRSFPRAD